MTVIVSMLSQQYTPRTFNGNFSVPAGTKIIKATLTRESWPTGPVGGVGMKYPDGTTAAAVTFNGGVQTGVDGSIIPKSGVQVGSATGPDLPAGNYSFSVDVLQTLTTAVLVERF